MSCDCPSGSNLYEKEDEIIVNCAWNKQKQWLDEGANAIMELREFNRSRILKKLQIVSHNICQPHMNEEMDKYK